VEAVGGAATAPAKPRPAKPLAPAVARAVRIIGYLGETEDGASVSDIARALSINKSTCFNILSTLVENQVVSKHPRFHIYRLGPRLVEWGRASRRQFAVRSTLRESIGRFVDELSLTCLVAQTLADNRGIVIFDRVVPTRPDVLTVPIGHVFPLSSRPMGRLVLSSYEDEEAISVGRQLGFVTSDDDAAEFARELAEIRLRGYSASRSEYPRDTNGLAIGLSPSSGEMLTLLCVIGYRRDFPDEEFDAVGRKLVAFGQDLLSSPAAAEAVMAWSVGAR
jgi:DNA-binding IclR family transcriptional regulator